MSATPASLYKKTAAVVLASLLLTCVVASTEPTIAEADTLTDEQWAQRQERLDYYADRIVGGRDSNEVGTLSWYTDMEYAVETNNLTVWTKGPYKFLSVVAPNAVSDAASEGITITEISKSKSLAQLLDEQKALETQLDSDATITSYSIDVNATASTQSMEVTTSQDELTDESASAPGSTPADVAEDYESELEADLGFPVKVTVQMDTGAATTVATRQDDNSAWYGGIGLRAPEGYCSSAFGAHRGSTWYLLTAYHCGAGSYSDRRSESIGNTGALGSQAKAGDVAAIQVKAGDLSASRVYDGAYDDATGFAKNVRGKGNARKGKKFCTSGANSGVHCGLKVYRLNTSVKYKGGQKVFGLARAKQTGSGIAVAKGDSGGPVFGPYNGSWNSLQAIGIISGGNTSTTCPATAVRPVDCFKNVLFQPVGTALTVFGLTLNT